MRIFIDNIVLWSKKYPTEKRKIKFYEGKVNVITGNSQTGKTAIIPIIDYCLCSSYCKIPIWKIRDSCSWFGILIVFNNQEILIARKSPENNTPSSEVMLIMGEHVKIPEIPSANTNLQDAKIKLNLIFGFPFLEVSDVESRRSIPRPSFRDVISFCFQPQNVIANPDTFFFKCNEFKYAERMRMMFPFAFGAINDDYFVQIEELKKLKDDINALKREMQTNAKIRSDIAANSKAKLLTARSLGIYDRDIYEHASVEHYINEVSALCEPRTDFNYPELNDTQSRETIELFSSKEKELTFEYAECKRRLNFIDELSSVYSNKIKASKNRREYLSIANEILNSRHDDAHCPFCGSHSTDMNDQLSASISGLQAFEKESKKWGSTYSTALDRERLYLLDSIKDIEGKFQGLYREKKAFLNAEENQKKLHKWSQQVATFLGGLAEFISTITGYYMTPNIHEKIVTISSRINYLERLTAYDVVQKRLKSAIDQISEMSSEYTQMLGAEWHTRKPTLDIKNLTIRIEQEDGYAYLGEIGSASNWLAYHLAFHLGIHKYALNKSKFIPSFITFDQPTQVYFPTLRQKDDKDIAWDEANEDDLMRSKNIFRLLNQYVEETSGQVQILLLEHAPTTMFSDLENIVLVEEWRDDTKLIPRHWLNEHQA